MNRMFAPLLLLTGSLLMRGTVVAQSAVDVVSAEAVDALSAPIVLPVAAISNDPHGPMKLQVPPNLCGIVLPLLAEGLPPVHPLADLSNPETQRKAKEFADQEYIRGLQGQFCEPLLDKATADKALQPLPAFCGQPAAAAALIDPIHPLVDANRADVIAAKRYQLAALEELEKQRALCKQLATGIVAPTNAPLLPAGAPN